MENKKLKYACDLAKLLLFYPFFIYFKDSGLWEDVDKIKRHIHNPNQTSKMELFPEKLTAGNHY